MQPPQAPYAPPTPQAPYAPPTPQVPYAPLVPPPSAALAQPTAPKRPLPEQKVSPKSDRTMLGIPANAPVRAPTLNTTDLGATSSSARAFTLPEADAAVPVRRRAKKRPGVVRPLLAALAGAFVVLLAGLLIWHFYGGPNVGVRIVQGDTGEALEIAVPDAPPNAKVRFASAEQGLRGGVALFPLAADALALGDNDLSIGIVRGGEVETTQVRLHVAYRARVDTSGLERPEPALDVIIEALPGSKVTLDGAPLPLDARGRGARSYPVGPQTGTKLAFEARYAIQPAEGPATEGALTLALPVTSVQVDRPGSGVTSDQPSIQVVGAVEAGATITVDGQPVKAEGSRFRAQVRLPSVGEHTIRVRARSPGKAPREISLAVTRVADLAEAAAGFEPDPQLTYARVAEEPSAYRGRKVAFEGRVYNVEVTSGASHLQLLVKDCPRGQRCPLWVELSQATEIAVDTSVRVLGTVAGVQQFRSERGQVHTVPSVHAQYVLKSSR